MKPELTNNSLQPPEKPLRRADEDSIEGTIKWVREFFQPEEIFDLYNHDREVAKNFHNWFESSGWMDATIINDGLKIGEYFINTSVYTQDKLTFEQLWEVYCKETIK